MTKTPTKATKKKNSKEVTAVTIRSEGVEKLINVAVKTKADVEVMERLFNLRKDVKAEEAKSAFVTALAKFQMECPPIRKTKKVMNKDKRTVRYMYAPLDGIAEQIREPLMRNGLSYSWNTKKTETGMMAICTITHEFGHSEANEFEVPIQSSTSRDGKEFMTAPQTYASALTFAKRYTLCNGLGISTADEDDDANSVNSPKDALSKKSRIVFLLRGLKEDTKTAEACQKAVKRHANLELEEENYDEIITRLEALNDEIHADNTIQG